MRILVVGAGATGGYFGARLIQAGRDVTFLVRPRRAAQLRASGLRVRTPNEQLWFAPRLVTAAELDTGYDLLLLAVKAYSLAEAARTAAAAVGRQGLILPLLNGMRHLDVLAGRFGEQAVLGGLCQLTTVTEPDGVICQLNERHELIYGVRHGPPPVRLAELAATLGSAGFVARQSADILAEMWAKWVHVAALGALNCLMRAPVGGVVAVPGGAAFAERVLAECAAVAAAAGHPIAPASLQASRATLTEPGSAAATSLYRDLIAGRELESEQVIGDLVDRAGALGVPVPLLGLVRLHLQVYRAGLPAIADEPVVSCRGATSVRVPEFRSATGPAPARRR